MHGPDFTEVDSMEKALALAAKGDLEKMLLLPVEFGGADAPSNTVYVPVGIAALKAQTDQNVIAPLAAQGKLTRYAATPRYSGNSFVPVAVQITASEPGHFAFKLKIWGEGLADE